MGLLAPQGAPQGRVQRGRPLQQQPCFVVPPWLLGVDFTQLWEPLGVLRWRLPGGWQLALRLGGRPYGLPFRYSCRQEFHLWRRMTPRGTWLWGWQGTQRPR